MTRSLAPTPLTPTLSVSEAAALLGISRGAAYESIRTGEFPVEVLRIGRRILVPTAPLLAVLGVTGPVPSGETPEEKL